jgi:hypothetical protein
MSAVFATETTRLKNGLSGKMRRVKRNRSGNPLTIGIDSAMNLCEKFPRQPLDPACRRNIEALIEVRDNAVHFYNDDRELVRRIHEIGAAALANFSRALDEWFGIPPSTHRFAILPLSFEPLTVATALVPAARPKQIANLMRFLDEAADAHPYEDGKYACSLRVETRIVGGRQPDAVPFRLTSDPSAPRVTIMEEQFREKWPMNYEALKRRLKARNFNLKFNNKFNNAMRSIKAEPRLAFERKLDPANKKSQGIWFYSDAAVDAILHKLGTVPAE